MSITIFLTYVRGGTRNLNPYVHFVKRTEGVSHLNKRVIQEAGRQRLGNRPPNMKEVKARAWITAEQSPRSEAVRHLRSSSADCRRGTAAGRGPQDKVRGEDPMHQCYLVHFSTLRKVFETALVIRSWKSMQKKWGPVSISRSVCLCEHVSTHTHTDTHTHHNMLNASDASYIYVVIIK